MSTPAVEPLEPRLLLSGPTLPGWAHDPLGQVVAPTASASAGSFATQYVIRGADAIDAALAAGPARLDLSPLSTTSPTGLTPAQVRAAYGIDSIIVGSLIGDGAGQTIAIVDAYDDPAFVSSSNPNYIDSDQQKFNVQFRLSDFGGVGQPTFTKLDQNGGTSYPTPDAGWATEIALDVEWAHVIAPRANIVLIVADDNTDANLVLTAVNTARNLPGVSVVSMSFGSTESSSDLSESSMFLTPQGHAGVTFVAASGDSGSPGIYPAYSPNVLAVGGTSLSVSGTAYAGETGWSGSGGGQSGVELEPIWQRGVQTSGDRQIPDVSFVADPNSGVAVYDSYGEGTAAPWVQVGGTSLSSPCWAGLVAITNQIRAAQGLSPLDGRSETMAGLYSLSAANFHDVTSGKNGAFSAAAGYDLVTGIGTPAANLLVPALAATNMAPAVTVYSANMNTGPGWSYQPQWAYGQPTGGSGDHGGPDPTSGHTGANVVGYNLSGGYANRIHGTLYATTPAINCSGRTGVTLAFWRWLGVEGSSYDDANVQVSANGTSWTTVFVNPAWTIDESAWSYQTYDISSVADNQPTVYVRWGLGPTDKGWNYCGWNIDDVTLNQTAGASTGPRVTDPNIGIVGLGSGAGGTYQIGDTVTARWNNTSAGDANTGALAAANPVTVDFTQFGGPAAAPTTNAAGVWTASYVIAAGTINASNLNVSVTVTDLAGNRTTTADTSNLSVNNLAVPAIDVTSGGPSIPNGDSTPTAAKGTDFGSANASLGQSITRTFTISNAGLGTLLLLGSPAVTISGADPADFVLAAAPPSSVTPSGTGTFQIRFTPTNVGTRSAVVTISSNDPSNGTYSFAIAGTATALAGDANLDGQVTALDLQILANNWNASVLGAAPP